MPAKVRRYPVWSAQAPPGHTTPDGPIFLSASLSVLFLIYSDAAFWRVSAYRHAAGMLIGTTTAPYPGPSASVQRTTRDAGLYAEKCCSRPRKHSAAPAPGRSLRDATGPEPITPRLFILSRRRVGQARRARQALIKGLTQTLSAWPPHRPRASGTAPGAVRRRRAQTPSCTLPSS